MGEYFEAIKASSKGWVAGFLTALYDFSTVNILTDDNVKELVRRYNEVNPTQKIDDEDLEALLRD